MTGRGKGLAVAVLVTAGVAGVVNTVRGSWEQGLLAFAVGVPILAVLFAVLYARLRAIAILIGLVLALFVWIYDRVRPKRRKEREQDAAADL
jgi:uncharacterized membrane protein